MGVPVLSDFIEVIENKSNLHTPEEMIKVCKRRNNKKRDYLFVNKFQGKHIPQKPSEVLGVFDALLKEVEKGLDSNEKVLVVGFAETATAVGKHIANNLENCVYGLQTTREKLEGVSKLIEFEEEHSHAVGQWLYSKWELPNYDRVLFVEDEITTGNTILNFIEEFSKINSNTKYAVASILNWQNDKDTETYKEMGIDTYYIVRGKLKENIKEIEIKEEMYDFVELKGEEKGYYEKHLISPFMSDMREGEEPTESKESINGFLEYIVNYLERSCVLDKTQKKISVIGTEEYMYLPLLVANQLENDGYDVRFHATTRSPISITREIDYGINRGITLSSAYEESRVTYLYNLEKGCQKVIVITDTEATESFKREISALCREQGISDVTILQLTKH